MKTSLHGVCLDIFGIGILITGKSGIGKSELALSLISQGHRLIADDMTELLLEHNRILCRCPELLQDFLEVRGLGFLNIRAMYGDIAIKRIIQLQLIVHLIESNGKDDGINRATGSHCYQTILGCDIPVVTIPVAASRNLSVMIEAAVRHLLLKAKGYDAGADIIKRQQQLLTGETS